MFFTITISGDGIAIVGDPEHVFFLPMWYGVLIKMLDFKHAVLYNQCMK